MFDLAYLDDENKTNGEVSEKACTDAQASKLVGIERRMVLGVVGDQPRAGLLRVVENGVEGTSWCGRSTNLAL